jgi:hypothetical protein
MGVNNTRSFLSRSVYFQENFTKLNFNAGILFFLGWRKDYIERFKANFDAFLILAVSIQLINQRL